MSRLILLFISFALHAFVGWRLLGSLTAWPLAQVLLAAALLGSAVLMPLGLLVRRTAGRRGLALLSWAGMVAMGGFSSLFVFTVLRELVLLGAALAGVAPMPIASWSAWAVVAAATAATLFGAFNARRTAAVVSLDIPIADLPDALHGFVIVQISDIHVGPTIKAPYVQAIVDAVNRLGADMVAVTGDLVDGSVAELAEHVAPMARLASRHGTFFVTGNHEYYSGAHAWIEALRGLDMRVLMNEHVVLRHGDADLVVAGVADTSAHHFDATHRSDPMAALAGAPDHATVRLLLAHQPRSAAAAAEAGFHLQLSGHTHGGQFWPWNHFVRLQQPFTAGLHRLEQLWVYVSRGTGYWGPPKRLGAPSEITRLRLVPAPV